MIITVVLLAFLLRLIGLDQSFWLDESIGVIEVSKHGINGLLTQFLGVDNHPPLYYLFLDIWSSVFGYSEVSVRMLTVLFGVGTVYVTYLICRELLPKEKNFAIITCLLLATSQFHIYYSQEARMYSQAAFFASLAIYLFLKLLENTKNKQYGLWLLFSSCLVALFFSDYMPILLWPIFPIIGLVRKLPKRWWFMFFLSHLPLIFLGLLWLPTFLVQIQGGKWVLATLPAWKDVAGGATFKNAILVWMKFVLGRISFYNKLLYYSLVTIASVPILLSIIFSLYSFKKYLIIFLWLTIPLLLGFVMSIFFPAFNYFRFTYVIPSFYIVVGLGLWSLKNINLRGLLAGLIITFNFLSFSIYNFDQNQQREQWRQATEFLEMQAEKDDIVLFEFPEPFAPYRWYQKGKLKALGATDSISANKGATENKLNNTIADVERIYHFEYLRDLSDPNNIVINYLQDNGFEKSKIYNQFVGVGSISLWSKE